MGTVVSSQVYGDWVGMEKIMGWGGNEADFQYRVSLKQPATTVS